MVRPARKRPELHRIGLLEDWSDLRPQRVWWLATCSCGWRAPIAQPTQGEARIRGTLIWPRLKSYWSSARAKGKAV
jgi:hypothetical protein